MERRHITQEAGSNSTAASGKNPEPTDRSSRPPPAYHEVLLPEGVDPKFKSPEILWNLVEQKEVRRNSQSALEVLLALPD